MEIPDFLNVDCSEDEDAEDAAELEALLYSKIYYEDTVGDTETSVKLYTEAEVLIYFYVKLTDHWGSLIYWPPNGQLCFYTPFYWL